MQDINTARASLAQLVAKANNLAADAVTSARQGEALRFIASLAKEASGELERTAEHLKADSTSATPQGVTGSVLSTAGPPAAAAVSRALSLLANLAQQAHDKDTASLHVQEGVATSLNALISTAQTSTERAAQLIRGSLPSPSPSPPFPRAPYGPGAGSHKREGPGPIAWIVALVAAVLAPLDAVAGRIASSFPFLSLPYSLSRALAFRLHQACVTMDGAPLSEAPWVALHEARDMGLEFGGKALQAGTDMMPSHLADAFRTMYSSLHTLYLSALSRPQDTAHQAVAWVTEFLVALLAGVDVAWGVTDIPAKAMAYMPHSVQNIAVSAAHAVIPAATSVLSSLSAWAEGEKEREGGGGGGEGQRQRAGGKAGVQEQEPRPHGGPVKTAVSWTLHRGEEAVAYGRRVQSAFWRERARIARKGPASAAHTGSHKARQE